ncbi:MAG: hypothetical protein HRU70_03020 [Phycisphaeraceae bacterium]|nr:MAG: hypothetical protein HRU70_03020 [Phycisphaeraceae bacterium]
MPDALRPASLDPRIRNAERELRGECRHCGYDVSGLAGGMPCPECGTPIVLSTLRSRLLSDNLLAAPAWYLRRVAAGSAAMLVAFLFTFGGLVVSRFEDATSHVPMLGFGLILWPLGVWVVTQPKRTAIDLGIDLLCEGRLMRWAARLTQWGWLVAAVCVGLAHEVRTSALLAGATPGIGVDLLRWAAIACLVAAWAGLIPVCERLSDLMFWAGDEPLGGRLRGAAFGVAVGVPLLSTWFLWGDSGMVFFVFPLVGAMALTASFLVILWSLGQATSGCVWAIRNSHELNERDARVAQMKRERAEEMVARAPKAAVRALGGDDRLLPADPDAPVPLVGDEPRG